MNYLKYITNTEAAKYRYYRQKNYTVKY